MVQEKDLDTSHVWVTLINTELIGICFSGSETDLLSTTKYLLRGHIFIGLMPKCIKIFWGQSKIMVFQPRSEKHDLFLKRRKEGVVRLLIQCCQIYPKIPVFETIKFLKTNLNLGNPKSWTRVVKTSFLVILLINLLNNSCPWL